MTLLIRPQQLLIAKIHSLKSKCYTIYLLVTLVSPTAALRRTISVQQSGIKINQMGILTLLWNKSFYVPCIICR